MLEILVISRVFRTSEIADISNTLDEICLVFTEKSKFSFYFFREGGKINIFPSHFSLTLLGSVH